MLHLHREIDVGPDESLEMLLSNRANVLLLDDANYGRYRKHESFEYQGGGFADHSPFPLDVPHPGHWHIVVDLGGYPGKVRATLRIRANGEEE